MHEQIDAHAAQDDQIMNVHKYADLIGASRILVSSFNAARIACIVFRRQLEISRWRRIKDITFRVGVELQTEP